MPTPPTLPASRPESTSRRTGRETSEQILDAAEEVFAEKGFEGATLRDIAQRVGIRIPSLYNHFSSKDALYAAVLERGIGPVFEALGAEASGAVDPGELVDQMMQLLSQRPNLPRLVLHETLTGGSRLSGLLEQWVRPILERAEKVTEEGPAVSRWEADQLPNLVLAMYHVVVGYFAIAPLYRDIRDIDLLSKEELERQTRFLRKLVGALFAAPEDTED